MWSALKSKNMCRHRNLQASWLFFIAGLAISQGKEDWTFPPGFKFGAASAAYQVEGAWNVSDKSESIWDRFIHNNPEVIGDFSNGDVACDSYNQWERDIQIAKELGLHFYRFSLSWPRILPTGFPNHISEDGAAYYNKLIDGLLAEGIEPMVTLFHWDLPQSLQDLGGWTNPLIVDWFADYARAVYSLYADRVKTWLTINEPLAVCDVPYNLGILAPGILSPDHGPYLCNKFVLMAHAKAYRIYDEEFRSKYHGEVSIVNQLLWFEPWTEDDQEITELAIQNCAGRYSHAIYSKEGGWPPAIERIMLENSKKKGYPKSLLPAFTQEEIELIRGKLLRLLLAIREDGVNLTHYTAWTMLDNYEWMDGYNTKFGLYEVDFSDPKRTRTPRASAHYYASIIRSHSLNVPKPKSTAQGTVPDEL